MKTIKQKFIIDESGSMNPQRETVISGFNEQIETMQQEEKDSNGTLKYLVTLVKFSNTVTVIYKDQPLSNVKKLDKKSYAPNGGTALYDAIGQTIDTALLGETDTIVTIFTDGANNVTLLWTKATVKTLINIRQSENKWGFVYFGSNQDAWTEASGLGIQNAVNYTTANMDSAINAMSACRSTYTSSATSGLYNTSNLTCNVNKEDLIK